jgi:hypothetical protein
MFNRSSVAMMSAAMSAPVNTAVTARLRSGPGNINSANLGMRVRRAHQHTMQLTGEGDISDKAGLPAQPNSLMICCRYSHTRASGNAATEKRRTRSQQARLPRQQRS